MDGKRDNPNFLWVIGRRCLSTKRLLIMKCFGCQESNVYCYILHFGVVCFFACKCV